MLTISYLEECIPKIYCFILYKYNDAISFERIFIYLKDNYKFLPNFVHTDYKKIL